MKDRPIGTPQKHDLLKTAPGRNPLGTAALTTSLIALIICGGAIYYASIFDHAKTPTDKLPNDNPFVGIFNFIFSIIGFLFFAAGGLVGGTFAVVGISLGLASLRDGRTVRALTGLALGATALGLLITHWIWTYT